MSSVYSTRFAAALLPLGPTVMYTVPAGYVALVLDIEVFGPAGQFTLNIPGVVNMVSLVVPGAPPNWAQWRGRLVANAGEQLRAQTTVNGISATLTGQLLSL